MANHERLTQKSEHKSVYPIPTFLEIDEALSQLPHGNIEQARTFLRDVYNLNEPFVLELGGFSASTFSWGEETDITAIKARLAANGLTEEEVARAEEMMENTGFVTGYRLADNEHSLQPKIQALHALLSAVMIYDHLEYMEKNKIDTLLMGSTSSTPDTADRTQKLLKSWGLEVAEVQFYGLACASVSAAITDYALSHTSLEDQHKFVVAIGLESLSGATVNNLDASIQRIFGNGASVLAYENRNLRVISDTKEIILDEGNVTIPRTYTVPENLHTTLPENYLIAPSPHTHELPKIVKTDRGVLLSMYDVEASYPFAHMKGPETAKFFGRHAPPLILQSIINYYESYDAPLAGFAISHQPSRVVVDLVNHQLISKYEKILKTGEFNGKPVSQNVLDKLLTYPPPNIPWLMDNIQLNNISAGTIGVAIYDLISTNDIKPNVPHLMVGLGVGAVIQVSIVEFKV